MDQMFEKENLNKLYPKIKTIEEILAENFFPPDNNRIFWAYSSEKDPFKKIKKLLTKSNLNPEDFVKIANDYITLAIEKNSFHSAVNIFYYLIQSKLETAKIAFKFGIKSIIPSIQIIEEVLKRSPNFFICCSNGEKADKDVSFNLHYNIYYNILAETLIDENISLSLNDLAKSGISKSEIIGLLTLIMDSKSTPCVLSEHKLKNTNSL